MSSRKRSTHTKEPAPATKKGRSVGPITELDAKAISTLARIRAEHNGDPSSNNAIADELTQNFLARRARWQKKAIETLRVLHKKLFQQNRNNAELIIFECNRELVNLEFSIQEQEAYLEIAIVDAESDLRSLVQKRVDVIRNFVSHNFKLSDFGNWDAILTQNKLATTELVLDQLNQLGENYLKQIKSVIASISERKQEFDAKFEDVDKQIFEKIEEIEELRESLIRLRKNYEHKFPKFALQCRVEAQEKIDALSTPEIKKAIKKRTKIMKKWKEGHGEVCDVCTKVLEISPKGKVSEHRHTN